MNLFIFFGCLIWGYTSIKVITIIAYIVSIVFAIGLIMFGGSEFEGAIIDIIGNILILIIFFIFKFPVTVILWLPVIIHGICSVIFLSDDTIGIPQLLYFIVNFIGMILYFIKF